jgi:predicted enzyme related to lactoylglutathione lyase
MKKTFLISLIIVISFIAGYAVNSAISKKAPEPVLKRVTGIGGIFFKCKEPKKVKEWYAAHLGLNMDKYGTIFEWYEGADSTKKATTQWSAFSEKTSFFAPSTKEFMINYRVQDLDKLLVELRKEGVTIVDTIERYDYGNFLHIMDIEGNKIELWQPKDHAFENTGTGRTK